MSAPHRPELSLVIPVFNEELELPQVDVRLKELLARLTAAGGVADVEVVFVDDGSRDRSMDSLLRFAGHDPRYRVLSLSRRFGRDRAVAAGLDKTRGRAVIVTDSELQPPEVFLETIDKWKAGFDVVIGKRKARDGGGGFGAGLVESLFSALVPVEVPIDAGDFRLLSRRVVRALRAAREEHRSTRGLIAWAGFRQATVEFERLSAEKHVGFGELLGRALEGVGAFSTRPLRIASWLGALLAVCSIVFGIVATAVGLGFGAAVVPFLFAVQFMLIGILGEYVGRIYEQVKRRPLYVVAQRIGFTSKKRAQKLATRDIEEVPSFPRTPSVPPALPQRVSKPPSLPPIRAASVTPPAPRVATSDVPPPPAAIVAAGAAAEASISQPRQRAASIIPADRPSVTPAAPTTSASAKPPPLKLSSSIGAMVAAEPAPVIPERASTPPAIPRRPSFSSIPHPAVSAPSRPPVAPRPRPDGTPATARSPSNAPPAVGDKKD